MAVIPPYQISSYVINRNFSPGFGGQRKLWPGVLLRLNRDSRVENTEEIIDRPDVVPTAPLVGGTSDSAQTERRGEEPTLVKEIEQQNSVKDKAEEFTGAGTPQVSTTAITGEKLQGIKRNAESAKLRNSQASIRAKEKRLRERAALFSVIE